MLCHSQTERPTQSKEIIDMASQITFTDKSNNKLEPSIAANEKVSAGDLNEIKTVVNANSTELAANTAKLSGIESDAKDDQTGAEIESLIDTQLAHTNWKNNIDLEYIQDAIAAMFSSGTHTNLTISYDDAAGTFDFVASGSGGSLSQEQVEDMVGVLVASGTGVNAVYDDAANTLTLSLAGEDFTTALKTKLDGIAVGAQVNPTAAAIVSSIDTELGSSTWQQGGGGVSSPTASTVPISFENLNTNIYGTPSTPLASVPAFDETGAVDGGKAILYYQGATDPFASPTMTGHEFWQIGGQAFGANFPMIYEMYRQADTTPTIMYKPGRLATDKPTLTGVSLDDGANVQSGVALTLLKTYAQAQGIAEDAAKLQLRIYRAATQAELTDALIQAGTPTKILDGTGVVTYIPTVADESNYIKAEVRAYSTDSTAQPSEFAYSAIYGPVAAASSYAPTDSTATVLWYDFTSGSGGNVGTLADHWETVYNKADQTNETDYIQTTTVKQFEVTNQATNLSAEGAAAATYQAGSWTRVADLIASGATRTVYAIVKVDSGVTGDHTIMRFGGSRNLWVNIDAGSRFVKFNSNSLITGVDSIDPTQFLLLKMGYDGTDSSVEILAGQGTGTPLADTQSTQFAAGEAFNSTNGSFDMLGSTEFRHVVMVDSTITSQETTDLEAWLVQQQAL